MQNEIKKRRPRKRRWRRFKEGEVRRGTYILPNLFTTGNLFSGFFGIISSINGNYEAAAIAILVSCIFDILDGKVARFTRATSRFGVEYDSLADLVAFGVGPGILMYLWVLRPFGRIGWLAGFVFMACGALRLARFNVQVETSSKKYFVGLPIPGGASMIATTVLFLDHWKIVSTTPAVLLLVWTFALGALMVSTIPYYSFKEVEFVRAKPITVLSGSVVLLSIIALSPGAVLFTLMLIYLVSGIVIYIRRFWTGPGPTVPLEGPPPVSRQRSDEEPFEAKTPGGPGGEPE